RGRPRRRKTRRSPLGVSRSRSWGRHSLVGLAIAPNRIGEIATPYWRYRSLDWRYRSSGTYLAGAAATSIATAGVVAKLALPYISSARAGSAVKRPACVARA